MAYREKTVSFSSRLEAAIAKSWARDTSFTPERWSEQNPAYGHCAVTALVVHDFLGGKFRRVVATGPETVSHYFNELPDGRVVDLTFRQFPQGTQFSPVEYREREYLLSNPQTAERYAKLKERVLAELNPPQKALAYKAMRESFGENPLFDDEIYRRCFYAAFDSSCQKMKFGVVITHGSDIIYEGANSTIPPLRELCEPECIRLGIKSRTEQMLGACGHGEELGIWAVANAKDRIPLSECNLHVAGFYPDNRPWLKKVPEHTCLRCSTQMYNAGVGAILVPVIDYWGKISAEEAVRTAVAYARGEKAVSK
jgi:deoxycytidylate deaminase